VTSDEPQDHPPAAGWGPPPAPAYGYPGGYPGSYPGYAPPQPAGMAITALVLGIAALVLCWTAFGGIVLGLLAVVFGIVALRRARRGQAGGQGRAVAGLVTGALGLVLGVVFLFVWISLFNSTGFTDYVSCVRDAGGDQAKVQQCQDQFQQQVVPSAPSS
jgi:Domain of unknown function (DUF4190)